jgi:hypothetical protein
MATLFREHQGKDVLEFVSLSLQGSRSACFLASLE